MEKRLIKWKFLGSLLGAAIGDSLSASVEVFYRVDYEIFIRSIEGIEVLIYTDDTRMMLRVAESLIENKGFNGGRMARILVENIVGSPNRGI
ncbi:TPA: ADP-ribosylglycohydrolase family protein [Candidatus Bathyarchaeota archaeon]|nr:ADP-ribosylglycohydrolase family protein [Candidatus Bathyarchaeota archaeon]